MESKLAAKVNCLSLGCVPWVRLGLGLGLGFTVDGLRLTAYVWDLWFRAAKFTLQIYSRLKEDLL